MEIVHERCCGLDVHKKTVVACVLSTSADGVVNRQVRTFNTMTADLLTLADWLSNLGVTHVALESTRVYWRPVFNVLEDEDRTLLLVNPQHCARCRVRRPTFGIASGSPICCGMACYARVSSRRRRFEPYAS